MVTDQPWIVRGRRQGVIDVAVTPESAGWRYSGLRVVSLAAGAEFTTELPGMEGLVLPLAGGATVRVEAATDGGAATTFELTGRRDVFSAITDFAYLPSGSRVTLTAPEGGRIAIATARTDTVLPARYGAASLVAVEVRGAGAMTRQVNAYCMPGVFDAARLLVVEVLTPEGNWSSYPPHKHDETTSDECELEEIYYFEVARDGPAYHRVYRSRPDRIIDVCAEVRTGDVVLVPYGYHGPSMAAPGYDLYYLNVMAGPGERAWRVSFDPAHRWVMDTWQQIAPDPRVPLVPAVGSGPSGRVSDPPASGRSRRENG
ncbi:MAG: 5-deoxy-glucuronate isomerase [Acidothermus cellulolyticus]|nr:5-deoxy-glucuronate isomerase [Acidothermus cellulolyticus]